MRINVSGMNSKVKPKLNNGSTYLNRAADIISSLSIPSDFSYYSRLRGMAQDIRTVRKNVNNVNKWVGQVVNKFQAVEKKNSSSINSLLNKLGKISVTKGNIGQAVTVTAGTAVYNMAINYDNVVQKGYNLAETIVNDVKSGLNSLGAKISSAWESFQSKAEKTAVNFLKETKAKISQVTTGMINEVSKGVDKLKEGITTFAKKGWNKICEVGQSVKDGLSKVGACISEGWNSFCTDIAPKIWEGIKTTAASIANVVGGVLKGIGQFAESLVDVVSIIFRTSTTGGLIFGDALTYLRSLSNGTEDTWKSATVGAWKKTMSFVAEDHVGNAFADFYKNNAVGQWLDKHAIDICKSDGTLTNIFSGIGYVAGIITLTIGTMGIGTFATGGATALSFATTSAGIATTSGIGKYTQEAWGQARDSSWEGIERLYEKGEITQEEYSTLTTIRSLSDEQWKEIEKDYKNGNISKEEYEQIKQIREMPEDWTTFENGWKGLLYGVANGVWEGVQWYVGGKLAGWTVKGGSKFATSAVRVGADTSFNAFDTPFRTLISTISSGKTWDEAWNEQGGWESVITNVGIGLIGSTGGEVFDGVKLKKVSDKLNSSKVCNGLDEAIKKTLDKYGDRTSREFIIKELNKGNFSVITSDYGARNFVKSYFKENQRLLSEFSSVMSIGKKSNPQLLDWMSNILEKEMLNGNTEVRKFVSKYIELKSKYPNLTFEIDINNGSFWNKNEMVLKLGANLINDAGSGVLFHESGHLLFALVEGEALPKNYSNIMNQARVISSNNNTLKQVGDSFYKIQNKLTENAILNIEHWVELQGYSSIDEYIRSMADTMDSARSKLFAITNLKKLGFDDKVIDIVKKNDSNISSSEIIKKYIDSLISENYDYLFRSQYDYVVAISDIIDAVYLATGKDIYGNPINTPYSHKGMGDYYNVTSWQTLQLHELIANFSSLKALNHNQTLADIKSIFGEEFYNMLEELYNKFFN